MGRNYTMADSKMIQDSSVKRQHFLDNQADFIAEDPDFGGTFVTDWQTANTASENQESAETRDDRQTQETADVEAAMGDARIAIKRIFYYAGKAFSDNKGIRNEFGMDDYGDVGSSHHKMRLFLANLHNKAENKYKAELLAAQCTQAKIDAVLTAKNNLVTEDVEQEVFADNEPIDTKARVAVHNHTFSFMQRVRYAADIVYFDNPEKFNLFVLTRRNEPDQSIFNLLGTVSNAATASPLVNVAITIQQLGISTTTDDIGLYGFAIIPPGTYDVEFALAGYTTQTIQITIADDGTQNTLDVQLVAV